MTEIRFTTKRSVPKTIRFLSGDGQYQYGHLGFRTRQEADAFETMVENYQDAVKALEGLFERWEVFTGRDGWGNMEEAYYDLAKHAQNEWREAGALLQRIQGGG